MLRLYREEGLAFRRTRPKRRGLQWLASHPLGLRVPTKDGRCTSWHDTLAGGHSIRVLMVLDVSTRECVALVAQPLFRREDVARILSLAGRREKALGNDQRGTEPEFTSRSLDHWAYWNKVQLDFSRPGKPTDNAFIERFYYSLRRECLSQHYFIDLHDAQRTLDVLKDDYNNTLPHGSLDNQPPAHFTPAVNRPRNSQQY